MKESVKTICCIGAGYVGGPTMAVIADKCPHIEVNVVDINEKRISQWNNPDLSKLPIFEPGLKEIVERRRSKNLYFSCDIEKEIKKADMIFISVNTPTKKKGIGAGKASDLKWVEASARQVADYAIGHTIIVEKSTLPVRTAEAIKSILEPTNSSNKNQTFEVLSNPEFLAEGSAINDLINPDRILIGGDNTNAINSLIEIYKNWVPFDKILVSNIWSSELAKLTSNAFLAQRISSINSISALCEATGADIREVSRAIGSDSRIGSKFLDSGPGFGGSCFKKDILNLVYLCEYFGLPEVAKFWNEVVEINKWNQKRISTLITKKLFGTLSKKKITILGFAFKANTNDTRESAAIQICSDLIDEGAHLIIHDPKVTTSQIEKDLGVPPFNKEISSNNKGLSIPEGKWEKANSINNIFVESDAVLIITEWSEYSNIDWIKASKDMRSPAWVFDARSIVDCEEISKAGLKLWRIGDGSKIKSYKKFLM